MAAEKPVKKNENKRRTIAAIASGTVLVLLAGAGVFAAVQNPQEPALAEANPGLTNIPTAQQRLVCPTQPQLVSGVGENTDAAFAPGSDGEKTELAALAISDLGGTLPWLQLRTDLSAESDPTDLTPKVSDEKQQGQPATVGEDGQSQRKAKLSVNGSAATQPSLLTSYPLGGRPGLINAARSYTAPDGDLAGLASSDCIAPRHEQWITGLTTEVGATGVIGFSNPTDTTAVVNLDFYGSQGKVQAPGAQGIVLGPGESRSFLAAGFAPDEPALTVRIRSTGGAVGAWATQTFLYGLDAGGVDYIPATGTLARNQLITGFIAQNPDSNAKYLQDEDRKNSAPALILSSPAATETTATIKAYSTRGEVDLPNNGEISIPAQGTAVFELDRLAAGEYTFAIQGDNLVTATGRTVRGDADVDIAYLASAGRLGNSNVVALPQNGDATLVFGQADGESTVSITPVLASGAMGRQTSLTLNGGATVRKSVKDLGGDNKVAGVLISVSGDRVYGNVHITGSGNQLTAIPIRSTGQANTAVAVSLSE
ncbi:DUF5719 family protein [Micrococcoides hystricis]|uniref:DUF5719 family protein n=1 Tax=Micrococcoides hystricis TaxID=1572761 RepID=A0ABV6PCF3_9MICC